MVDINIDYMPLETFESWITDKDGYYSTDYSLLEML